MSDNILQAIDNLITAVGQLTQAMNNQNIINIAQASSTCYCIVGQGQDTTSGEEGGDPPPPIGDVVYEDIVGEVDERKCDAADYLVDWLVEQVFGDILVDFNVQQYGALGLGAALGFIGGAIGAITTGPAGALVGAVAGLIIGIASGLLGVALDLQDMYDEMVPIKQDLICALYDATTADGARDAFMTVIDEQTNIIDSEQLFLRQWLPNALLNMLFFDITAPIDTATYFDGYVPVIGCEACVTVSLDWILLPSGAFAGVTSASGFIGSGSINQAGDSFTLDSVEKTNEPGTHAIGMIVDAFLQAQGTDNLFQTDPTGSEGGVFSRESNPLGLSTIHGRRAVSCTVSTQQPSTDLAPTTENDFQFVYYQGNSPFSITFSIVTPPSAC